VPRVKLLLIGGLVGLVIGVVLTVFYFSLAAFFAVNARALDATQKAAEGGKGNAESATVADKRKAGGIGQAISARKSHLPQDSIDLGLIGRQPIC
jgi:hypothetical protein